MGSTSTTGTRQRALRPRGTHPGPYGAAASCAAGPGPDGKR